MGWNDYDGRHFTGDSPDTYNPFSLMSAFTRGWIDSFWFGSGTPAAVVSAIRLRAWQVTDLLEQDVLESEFDGPTELAATPVALIS